MFPSLCYLSNLMQLSEITVSQLQISKWFVSKCRQVKWWYAFIIPVYIAPFLSRPSNFGSCGLFFYFFPQISILLFSELTTDLGIYFAFLTCSALKWGHSITKQKIVGNVHTAPYKWRRKQEEQNWDLGG